MLVTSTRTNLLPRRAGALGAGQVVARVASHSPSVRTRTATTRQGTGDTGLPGRPGGALAVEQVLRPGNPLTETFLEGLILAARLDVLGDGRADHIGDWLIVDGSDQLKLFCLLGAEPDRHGFRGFHQLIVPPFSILLQVSW